jgi:cellulose synthase/poly-beta-1,6-N-acetylglucosamine synthase-like glycosyltransferase
MSLLLERDVEYIVDDTQWLLDIQTEHLGRVVYARRARAYVQDPTTLGSWYKQTLRWMHGSMQGIRGHRIGRRCSWFSITYSALIFDWLLYVAFWPALLVWLFVRADTWQDAATTAGIYVAGYAIWAAIGAVALRNWRMLLMFPTLIVMDWIQRALFVHAFVRTWREPTSECKWVSPTRHDTRQATS